MVLLVFHRQARGSNMKIRLGFFKWEYIYFFFDV